MLSDEQKRGAYDRFGHAGVDPNAGAGGGMGGAGFADAFGDIFGEIFGGGGGRRGGGPQVYRGADLKYTLDISLEQAANGFDTEIPVPRWKTRPEEHTTELQSLMRRSSAVFCLTKKSGLSDDASARDHMTTRHEP